MLCYTGARGFVDGSTRERGGGGGLGLHCGEYS